MDAAFWHGRWSEGRIGFHEGAPNAALGRHHERLGAGRRVLVPLCGKAEDLAFLAAQGHEVVGVELVESAVQAFFDEHALTPQVTRGGPLTRWVAGPLTLLSGDVFEVTAALLGPVNALYDRAALVALPEAMRADYVRLLRRLLPTGSPGLLVTLEYAQGRLSGPPFSVPEAELRALFDGCALELLEEGPADGPRFTEAGAIERCHLVRL